jgi:16S rRNA processing protein RimM
MIKSGHLLIGEIVGFHGLRGEVKLRTGGVDSKAVELLSESDSDESNCLICLKTGKEIPAAIKSVRDHKGNLLLSFAEYPDRTAVEKLLGGQVFIEHTANIELAKDEWWESDLVGMQVFTEEGLLVGVIGSVIPGPSTTLEVIPDPKFVDMSRSEGKTILIPFVESLVPTVDIKAKKVQVVDLPGLLEPQ